MIVSSDKDYILVFFCKFKGFLSQLLPQILHFCICFLAAADTHKVKIKAPLLPLILGIASEDIARITLGVFNLCIAAEQLPYAHERRDLIQRLKLRTASAESMELVRIFTYHEKLLDLLIKREYVLIVFKKDYRFLGHLKR